MSEVKKKRRRSKSSPEAAKKKRRRSKSSPEATKKKTTTKRPRIPSMAQRTKDAKVLEETANPTPVLKGMARLNAIPDYTKTLQSDIVAKTFAKYQAFGLNELKRAAKDPDNTVLELSAIMMCLRALKDNDNSLLTSKYIHSWIDGKPKERVELTGDKGGPIQTQEVEFDVENMNKEERKQLKEHLLAIKAMKTKVKDERSAESE